MIDNSTAALLGQAAGSIVAVYLFHAIWEFALFRRIMDDPVKGKLASVIAAYLTVTAIYGLGTGAFNPIYLVGAAVVGFFAVRRGIRLRDQPGALDDIEETFS